MRLEKSTHLANGFVRISLDSAFEHLRISVGKVQKKDFLWKIVAGDEKWIYFDNPNNKKQWLSPGHASAQTPKRNVHDSKMMLCA